MALGIIMVHGYTGSHLDLKPLTDELSASFGKDSVTNLSLPGHDLENIPEFNEDLFIETIYDSIKVYMEENRKLIIIGHSTGGSLVLSTLTRYSINPELLILFAVPQKINWDYFKRWDTHRSGKAKVSLVDVSMMVKLINSTGSKRFESKFPALLIHGEDDELVLASESHTLNIEVFSGSARVVTIPQVGHDIFKSSNSLLIIDIIRRAISDISLAETKDEKTIDSLLNVEPGFKDFFKAAPFSESHLALCPSAQRVIEKTPELLPRVLNDPVIANIEITTYCNLKCRFCARTRLKKRNKHMPFDLFRNILALLPNTYKIVLVGLGETLLHPKLVDFIKYAKSQKRKVGLVTNAMLLKPEFSKRILEAGLDSIAFSIDGSDVNLSSLVRNGTDFNEVIGNIKEFITITKSTHKITTAVFSAVSIDTVSHLKDLIDRVSELGVDVLMLSDINFKANLNHTLWQNRDENIEETVRRGVSYAFSKNLPILSVHGLEEFGIEKRYHDFLLIPPGQLYNRSQKHTWCFSPWQTLPIDVDGNITLCDCQPEFMIGNLFQKPFSQIWNGEAFQKYRIEILSGEPPEACKICPRF